MIDKLVPREFKSDQDVRLTPPTVFIDALNITLDTDDGGNSGVVKPIKGTSLVDDNTNIDYTGEAQFDVVGSCRDNDRRRTYLFVQCSDSNKNAILRYRDDNSSLSTVLQGAFLDFVHDSHVSSDVINGDFRGNGNTESLLFWTDGISAPRKINVDDLSRFDNQTTLNKRRLTYVMKRNSLVPPKVSMVKNETIGVSNFSTGSFQFATQYLYEDGEVTALSPYSEYVYPFQRMFPGSLTDFSNVCRVQLQDTSMPADVKAVRILYRENNGAEITPFRIIDEFNPNNSIVREVSGDPFTFYDAGSKCYSFLNNGYIGVLSSEEEDRPYQHIPKLTKCQSIANGRVVYANYLEGFGNLNDPDGAFGDNGTLPNVTFEVNYSEIPSISETTSDVGDLWDSEIGQHGDAYYIPLYSSWPQNFVAGSQVSVKVGKGYLSDLDGPSDFGGEPQTGESRVITNLEWEDGGVTYTDSVELSPKGIAPVVDIAVSVPVQSTAEEVVDILNEAAPASEYEFIVNPIPGFTPAFTTTTHNAKVYAVRYNLRAEFFIVSNELRVRYKVEDLNVFGISFNGETLGSPDIDDFDAGNAAYLHIDESNQSNEQINGLVTISAQPGINGFTSGSSHSIAFAYIDELGRYGSAQEVGSFYVPPIGDISRKDGSTWYNGPAYVRINPTHDAPEWASRFAVLYAGPDDVDQQWDLFIDDATAHYRTTNTFPKIKKDSVFVNISTFIEEQRLQGIDFASQYVFEPGDKLRIISKRDTVLSGYYTTGNGWDSPPFNPAFNGPAPHQVTTTQKFWSEFPNNAVPFGDTGDIVEFEVLGITEISKNTDVLQYPFGSGPDGQPIPGTYLELSVPRDAYGWGAYNFQVTTAGENSLINRTLDNGTVVKFNQLGDNLSDNAEYNELWDSIADWAYDNNPLSEDPDNFATQWYNREDGRQGYTKYGSDYQHWKEWHRDLDYTVEQGDAPTNNRNKQLHKYSFWDKGVRAMLIKPKDRQAARVYHEVGVVRSPLNRAQTVHGGPFNLSDGYSWYRSNSKFDVLNSVSEVQLLFGTAGSSGGEYGRPTAGGSSTFGFTQEQSLPPDRKDVVNTTYGGLVRVEPGNPNPIVESFYTFPGAPDQVRNIGRLNVVSKVGERERCYSMIHSGFYGSETLRLTLADFDSFNFKDMDVNNGCINAISPDDQHLLVLQNSKVSRVPLSRSILATAGGDNNLTTSNTVLGPEMSFTGDYGLGGGVRNMINIDGVIYFIDQSTRAIIKISPKGFAPINFVDVSEAIEDAFIATANSSQPYAIGYDRERKYVFFTFPGHGTFGYDHIKGVWLGRYSFQPVSYAFNEDDMLSFKVLPEVTSSDDVVIRPYAIAHRHNAESSGKFANFYDNNNSMSVTMVSTLKQPSVVKTYNAVGIEGGRPSSVVISNDDQAVTISGSKFEEKENRFYMEIPYDDSNLKNVRLQTTTTTSFKGNIVPIGRIKPTGGINGDRFNLDSPILSPLPINQNATLVVFRTDSNLNDWVSVLADYNDANGILSDGMIAASNITGFGENYIESSGFFSNTDYSASASTYQGLMLGYVTTTPSSVSDTTWSGTTISQPYGGKKVRDYYAEIDVTYPADGASRELYAISVDVDESKLHM